MKGLGLKFNLDVCKVLSNGSAKGIERWLNGRTFTLGGSMGGTHEFVIVVFRSSLSIFL